MSRTQPKRVYGRSQAILRRRWLNHGCRLTSRRQHGNGHPRFPGYLDQLEAEL